MADLVLPYDTLREISAHWAGHRLHYTCRGLYASWDPANYVIVRRDTLYANQERREVVTSRMPNGAFHGECSTSLASFGEVITYYRGRLVSLKYGDDDNYHVITTLIDGWYCSWSMYSGNKLGRMQLSMSPADGYLRLRPDIPHCDFIATAHAIISQIGVCGGHESIMTLFNWGCKMPQTHTVPGAN